MAIKKIMVEMEVWCEDSREFGNLMKLINDGPAMEFENGRYCGFGYNVKVQEVSEKEIRKALGFKKEDVKICEYE